MPLPREDTTPPVIKIKRVIDTVWIRMRQAGSLDGSERYQIGTLTSITSRLRADTPRTATRNQPLSQRMVNPRFSRPGAERVAHPEIRHSRQFVADIQQRDAPPLPGRHSRDSWNSFFSA